MIGQILRGLMDGISIILWLLLLPMVGLYRTGWFKPLIVVTVLIPMLALLVEGNRLWVDDASRCVRAYLFAQIEHFPATYPDNLSLPETVLGHSFPEHWQTYDDAKAAMLDENYVLDYLTVKTLLTRSLNNALKLNFLLLLISCIYGAIYLSLAA